MLNRVIAQQQTELLKRSFEMLFESHQWCWGKFQNQCPECRMVVPEHLDDCKLAQLQTDIKEVLRVQGIRVDDTLHCVRIEKDGGQDG